MEAHFGLFLVSVLKPQGSSVNKKNIGLCLRMCSCQASQAPHKWREGTQATLFTFSFPTQHQGELDTDPGKQFSTQTHNYYIKHSRFEGKHDKERQMLESRLGCGRGTWIMLRNVKTQTNNCSVALKLRARNRR